MAAEGIRYARDAVDAGTDVCLDCTDEAGSTIVEHHRQQTFRDAEIRSKSSILFHFLSDQGAEVGDDVYMALRARVA